MEKKQTNSVYQSYFTEKGIEAFNELFPNWKRVKLIPIEKNLINLFESPINTQQELIDRIQEIADEHNYKLKTLKPKINKVIAAIAKSHDKTLLDWQSALDQIETQEFLTKYPDWEKADLPGLLKEVLILLFGLNDGVCLKLTTASVSLGISRQAVQERRDRALDILDVYHGYSAIEKTGNRSLAARQDFAEKLKIFRGDRTRRVMSNYFQVEYADYCKLESADVKFITDRHYNTFTEVFQ
jgi:hypothetical protein